MSARSEELTDLRDEDPAGGDSNVPQDVAEETARAVAEATGDGGGSGGTSSGSNASGAGSRPGASDGDGDGSAAAGGPNGGRRDRHTFLYGKGRRVLPWQHKSRLDPAQRRRRKFVTRSLSACVLVFVGTVGWSVGEALTAPGTDTIQVRLAEWGRDHGLGGVVTALENLQYKLNPPPKGGAADAKQLTDLGPTAEPEKSKPSNGKPGTVPGQQAATIPMRPAITSPASSPEAGEGVFHVAVAGADGQPIIQVAKVRPDNTYTSVWSDILWIDQKHTKYVLHPGHEGGINKIDTTVQNQIVDSERPSLIALFNGGFKISESHGGYFNHGAKAADLVDGAASEVISKDGHLTVGQWGRDLTMTPDVVSVRQNLKLLVDNGQISPNINDAGLWGRTDKGSAAVWRSGVGVTAQGDIVWVGGNLMTANALADLLQRAGAVRGMQLDINLRWADFQYFPNRDGNPDTSKLYTDFLQGPTKYFYDSTKDFMAVYAR